MVHVAIAGARGYLGRVLVGILAEHPHVDELTPVSTSQAGRAYSEVVPSLAHLDGLTFAEPTDAATEDAEAILLATSAAEAGSFLEDHPGSSGLVVDLSRAHREHALGGANGWVYGLPEIASGVSAGSTRIANPGCYPTATLIASAPALAAGLAGPGPLIADGKSGVSGAGATPRADLHYPETNESVRAYSVLDHDHTAEIQAGASTLEQSTETARPVRFTPHLVPQNRGLLATVYIPLAEGAEPAEVQTYYEKFYEGTPFVRLVDEPDTAHVRGTNFAEVSAGVDDATDLIVARCAIDNLVKGGAGTAIQNLNLALGLDETVGLPTVGVQP